MEITLRSIVKETVLETIDSLDGLVIVKHPLAKSFTSITRSRFICINRM